MRRAQGFQHSLEMSRDLFRLQKRAGRINAAPRNVAKGPGGQRVVMPTSAQISGGTAPPNYYRAADRQSRVDAAKSDGSFAQKRFEFNRANAGKQEMDDNGNITPSQPASSPPAAQQSPPPIESTPPTTVRETPTAPPNSGPPQMAQPGRQGVLRDETGDRTASIQQKIFNRPSLSQYQGVEARAKSRQSSAPVKSTSKSAKK